MLLNMLTTGVLSILKHGAVLPSARSGERMHAFITHNWKRTIQIKQFKVSD